MLQGTLKNWIVIANNEKGFILETRGYKSSPLIVETFECISSIIPEHMLNDQGVKEGTDFNNKEAREDHFAKEIANFINKSALKKQFDRLIIAASPDFLTKLRQNFKRDVKNLIVHEIDQNLISLFDEDESSDLMSLEEMGVSLH